MRTTFIDTLTNLAAQNEKIWLLTGDLGYSVVERFSEKYQSRFINAGVAEQNMMGMASGLAIDNHIVFVYSISNFPIMRCLEQIRNDVCYHNLNVKIVAIGGGLSYGTAGYTHHALEDLAIMRVMPNMTVLAPGDSIETKLAVEIATRHNGPCYIRITKDSEFNIHQNIPEIELGKSINLRDGKDVTLISTGGMLRYATTAAEILSRQGISVQVISMLMISPLDKNAILSAAKKTKFIVTLEEHGPGGLFSAVAEVLASNTTRAKLFGLHTDPTKILNIGSQEYLLEENNISQKAIVHQISNFLGSKKRN